MLRTIIKSVATALSLTLMALAAVYTLQSREAAATAPKRIGDARVERPFLVDFAETRKEMVMSALRDRFPGLVPPSPQTKAAPDPLSLEALRARTIHDQTYHRLYVER